MSTNIRTPPIIILDCIHALNRNSKLNATPMPTRLTFILSALKILKRKFLLFCYFIFGFSMLLLLFCCDSDTIHVRVCWFSCGERAAKLVQWHLLRASFLLVSSILKGDFDLNGCMDFAHWRFNTINTRTNILFLICTDRCYHPSNSWSIYLLSHSGL